MANHLARPPPSATSPLPISSTNGKKPLSLFLTSKLHAHETSHDNKVLQLHNRRAFTYGLIGAATLLSIGTESVKAAARRPPPPPAVEKKDPNVSGVAAKVLASKKRKEAMKEEIAKLKEKGKIVE
ncbi:hypothetical protein J5N97_022218 [Dioscorea zingiberensis]|uniref:Uncharacterized protein n=1 Tax=Dioscorea zingiberensis TaxID=325984 RepID=A0A9D5CA55_9LILI|nr:hypothetical protein J5N97_022218 [Dioscorea zingiberensis]